MNIGVGVLFLVAAAARVEPLDASALSPTLPTSASGSPERPASPDRDSALPVVREMLESDDLEIRVEGLDVLDKVSSEDMVDLKYKALFDREAVMRRRAAERLRAVPGSQLAPRVLDTLHTGTLFEIQVVEEVVPTLQDALEQPFVDVLEDGALSVDRRVLAAYALGCMKASSAIEGLARLVWQDNQELAMACVQALGRMRSVEAFPYLQSMLGHSSENIRWETVHGVGNLRTPEALHALVAVATSGQETNAMIRRQALLYLGSSDQAEAIPLLMQCMQYSQNLRDVAGEALRQLTGQRIGASPIEWQRWYEEALRTARSPDELLYSYKLKKAARQAQQPRQLPVEIEVETVPE